MRLPCGTEQGNHLFEFFLRQMAELPLMASAERLPQLTQKRQPSGGDADVDDAAIVGRPNALYETAFLELVEQPRNVRRARNEPAG